MSTEELRVFSDAAIYLKDSVENGVDAPIRCTNIAGQVWRIDSGVMRLEDEWYEDARYPLAAIEAGRQIGADFVTFFSRPGVYPLDLPAYAEHEPVARLALPRNFESWLKLAGPKTRNMIKKAEKAGVTTRLCAFDDAFIAGMVKIFNEAPSRQGRAFWHYGKDHATVKRQFSRYIHREVMIGAFLGEEMVGFVMLGDAGGYAVTGQIISALAHRDKAVTNALMAATVRYCIDEGYDSLVYYYWDDASSLTAFKRANGFEKIALRRHWVPLTFTGRVKLTLGLHKGLRGALPAWIKEPLKKLRARLA